MSNISYISRKIKSVQSILKLVESLRLISSSKLKSYREMRREGDDYIRGIQFLFRKFYLNYDHDYLLSNSKFIMHPQPSKAELWVIIGTDLGLCGRFNIQLLREFRAKANPHSFIIVFGRKLSSLFKGEEWEGRLISAHLSEINSSSINTKLSEISSHILREFILRKCTYLKILWWKNRRIRELCILPFRDDYFQNYRNRIHVETHFFQVKYPDIILELFPFYFESILLLSVMDSKIMEHNYRRELMSNAVSAAEEKLDAYRIIYQKMRQSLITQEISEINSALKCK